MTFSLSYSALAMVGFFGLLFWLETWRPLRRLKRRRAPRVAVNLAVTALGFVTGVLTVRPVALGAAAWAEAHGFGILNLLPGPGWAQLAGGILLMDFTFYHWHRLNHLRPWLWRFHNVHHVDPDMDVSTSFRFHLGEVLYSTAFRFLQVVVLGVWPATYLAYELLFNCATMFHHSNVHIPVAWERRLNKILVTPRMHGVHHSVVAQENYSNYSVVFSFWDRLNRSLRLNVPQGDIIIGVPGYLRPTDNRFFPLLAQPLARQRPYWRFPSGKAPRRATPAAVPDPRVMAE
jgi:sterol desaturase/sphingolipid hydroxylase (fatty acid hydroxylase superfamily)